LNLFAGNVEEGLEGLHAALSRVPADSGQMHDAFDDLTVALAVADGYFSRAGRFVQWLAQGRIREAGGPEVGGSKRDPLLGLLIRCERRIEGKRDPSAGSPTGPTGPRYGQLADEARKKLAKEALLRWERHLVRWGGDALRHGDRPWALGSWALAINAEQDPGVAGSLVDTVIDLARRSGATPEPGRLLREVLPLVPSATGRRHLLLKIARLLYEEADFAGCLAVLDQADELARTPREKQDMTVGSTRVMCLIRLKKFDEALGFVERMAAWPGTDAQHAQALFLAGWLYLRKDSKAKANAKALAVFRRIVDRYPKTTFAGKARELLQRLEGI